MGARHFDSVKPNREAFKKDLEKLGLTAQRLSKSMGKSVNYAAAIFASDAVERKTIEAIEDRMFADHGSYYTEITEEKEDRKEEPKPAISEGIGILLKQIAGAIGSAAQEQAKQNAELVKAIRETQAANELLLQDLLQKEKEICTLQARLLAIWERGTK